MGLGPLLKSRFILSRSFVESLLDKNDYFYRGITGCMVKMGLWLLS